jgi:hypothetical protein
MSAICVRLLLPCCGRRDYGAVAHLFPARSQSQKRASEVPSGHHYQPQHLHWHCYCRKALQPVTIYWINYAEPEVL